MFDFHSYMNDERRKSYDQGQNDILKKRIAIILKNNPNLTKNEAIAQVEKEFELN